MKDKIVLKKVKNDTELSDCEKCYLSFGYDDPICIECEYREYYKLESTEDTNHGWIIVDKDNLPDHEVIAINGKGDLLIGTLRYLPYFIQTRCFDGDRILFDITHYMLKPNPPEGIV